MATYHAIAAIGATIVGLLKAARPAHVFDNAQFQLYQASDFQTPMDEGVAVYLYHVAVNTTRRSRQPRIGPDGQRYRPSLPIDLRYLLVPWSKSDIIKQQLLLGWSMRVLENTPILPSSLLNYYSTEPDTFGSAETVELISDPISLQEIVNIWDAFKPNLQVSVAYVARMILIDSSEAIPDALPVQTRVFEFGKEPVS